MSLFYLRFRKWFSNLSLHYKIQLISFSCLLLLTGTSILITNTITEKYNKLILNSLSAPLSYINDDFTKQLEALQELSYTILSDPTLQQQLIKTDLATGSTETAQLYTQVKSRLHSYYLEHEKDYISYISLYTSQYECHTSASKARLLSQEKIAEILEAAHLSKGKAVWITDATTSHSLILAREIRQYTNLSLKPLGTMIICIDLNEMINGCPMFSQYESFAYQIMNHTGQMIYDSLNTPMKENVSVKILEIDKDENYQLIKQNGHWYLSSSGELFSEGWNYNCLVSYDSIQNTISKWRFLTALLLLSSCMIIGFASRYIIQSLTRHFNILIDKMQRFASSPETVSNFTPDSKYDYSERKDEIGMLHRQFDKMAVQISSLVKENYTKELLVKEAQLKALEMQINPHFLYNTLESINWRAKVIKATVISQMVESLGNLFRAILSHTGQNFTIEEELALVNDYLTIQKCRFGSRLICSINADPALSGICVPKLSIQPLVENAISHAMESICEECVINILVQKKGTYLQILVQNTGSVFEDHLLDKLQDGTITPKGFGIGLLNIDKRFRLMFGENYSFTLYNKNGMATACIQFPLPS